MTTFDQIAPALERQAIELPSWAFGNSGTRFKVFAQPGVPRDPYEKIADAAQVHALTGLGAVGRPPHPVGPGRRLRQARPRTPRTSASGSGRSTPTRSRTTTTSSAACATSTSACGAKAIAHTLECIDVMDVTGSRDLKIWLPDGANYPGQGDLRDRQDRLAESLAADLRPARRGPAAGARVQVLRAGVLRHRRARLGHVATCTASPSASGRSSASTPATTRRARTSSSSSCSCCASAGSARSTSTPASTPTTTSSSAPPTRSSCSGSCTRSCAAAATTPTATSRFMLDQCHNIEAKIPGQIRSVLNVQEMTARALLVDRDALARGRARPATCSAGNGVLMDAFYTDVRGRPRRLARRPGPARRPDGRLPAPAATPSDRRRPRRRQPGRLGRLSTQRTGRSSELARLASQPARRRSAQHQLRRRQHLGQGHRDRPGHRRPTSSCCGSRAPAATSAR